MSSIRDNLARVKENIARAEERFGREKNSVRLLAVSKTFPASDIAEALSCGQLEFGENRVQELAEKVPQFAEMATPPVWHLIGHLQSNKAAKAASLAAWIHSVNSVKLIEKLQASGSDLNILLELNLSGEESKTGLTGGYDSLRMLLDAALPAGNLHVKGLMTMAAFDAPETEIRNTFAALRQFRDRAAQEYGIVMPELSMGMSGDYEYAIAEGSTIVRIGTAIFGGR
ncbi:MAG: YggS family pyridoxal phosphate-dependent enzyme [Lentisphaeria bacterium]|nr:YggS family pyridoxal phosphate-dependent enzyme [Lentisphaeria bacterium]